MLLLERAHAAVARWSECIGDDGKARSVAGRGAKLDVVPEKVSGPFDDEEPEAEPARLGCRAALKCLKNNRLLLVRYAGAAVVHLDANLRTPPTASA